MHVKNIFNLQYDCKFIFSGGCTSVLPDGGSLSVGVTLFVLSSAVLPNVSVFAFSVYVFSAFYHLHIFSISCSTSMGSNGLSAVSYVNIRFFP